MDLFPGMSARQDLAQLCSGFLSYTNLLLGLMIGLWLGFGYGLC